MIIFHFLFFDCLTALTHFRPMFYFYSFLQTSFEIKLDWTNGKRSLIWSELIQQIFSLKFLLQIYVLPKNIYNIAGTSVAEQHEIRISAWLSFCSLQFFVLQLAKLLFAELWLKALLFFYWSHAIKIFPTPLAVIWYSYQMSSSLLTNSSIINTHFFQFKGALSGLRQFLANESPLKMMKSDFYFIVKALFVLKIFKFLSWLSGEV